MRSGIFLKSLAALLLCGAALCGLAQSTSQTKWFDGGIGADWPHDETMFGGEWSEGAESRGQMIEDNVLKITVDDEVPLSFDATYEKPLGASAAASNVAIDFSCAYQPFSLEALPSVPEDAKGAVILVTEEDDPEGAASGTLYYATWDGVRGKNWWRASDVTGVGTGDVVRVVITIATSATEGFLSVDYAIADRFEVTGVPLKQADAVVRAMCFTGRGHATRLEGGYVPGVGHALELVSVTGLVVTNITANGVSVGSGYGTHSIGDGSDVIVYYAAAPGYRMIGDGVLGIGVVTEDTTIDEDTPGVPEVVPLGKYVIGLSVYEDFASMYAAVKDGDVVEMLANDTLPSGTRLEKGFTFVVGGYVLSMPSGEKLTIAANVVFKANAAANLPPLFYVCTDCTLTLPAETAFDDYTLLGETYAHVVIGGSMWVWSDGRWQKSGTVEMAFYYPGYYDKVALVRSGSLGLLIEDERLEAFLDEISTDEFLQDFYWDAETETLIDGVYWFDGTWYDGEGVRVSFPTHYVAGDFYPHSTAIVYQITYDMGGVAGATQPNPTIYSIETSRYNLGDATDPQGKKAFAGWTNDDGETVTTLDPIAIGRESECLYDLTLHAQWSPMLASSAMRKAASVAFAPGEPAAYYDTQAAAQAAANGVNANKADGVLVPTGFTGSVADYADNFTASANGTSLAVTLTDEAEAELGNRVSGDTLTVASALTDPEVTTVTITDAKPGFYYSIVGGTLPDGVTTESSRVLAQEATVTLTKPDLGVTDKAFYKIKVAVKPQ